MLDHKQRNKNYKKTNSMDYDSKGYLSDNSQTASDNLLNILTKSFKPIIETAHKKFVRDNYSTVVKKVETDRLSMMGKSDMDLIFEKYFKKSLTRSQSTKSLKNNSPKKQAIKRKSSFLIENNIIDKKDILSNPCNKNFINITKTRDISVHKEFYEREKMYNKNYEDKKNQMRSQFERKILSELKPSPGIAKGSQRIIEIKNLDKRLPLYLRFKELAEEKTLKKKSMQKDFKRDSSNKMFNDRNTYNLFGKLTSAENNSNSNISINNFNSNTSGLIIKAASQMIRSKSYNGKDFGHWLETNKKWQKMKEFKTENLKNTFDKLSKEKEDENITFKPSISKNSMNLAELKKKNEHEEDTNIFDKLYDLNDKKKEYIQNLQLKYKPTFRPNINKYPQLLNNNAVNQTTKSFYLEEKEDEYEQMVSKIELKEEKNNSVRSMTKKDKPRRKESIEFNKFQKEVEKNKFIMDNKKNYKKSKKEIEEFFSKMNKGMSPNYGLEINDIKFYNDIHKN